MVRQQPKVREFSERERESLAEWVIRKDKFGDWRGWHEDGRRTSLKGSLLHVQEAILRNEFVCPKWPHCQHASPQHCAAAWSYAREQRSAPRRRYAA